MTRTQRASSTPGPPSQCSALSPVVTSVLPEAMLAPPSLNEYSLPLIWKMSEHP